MSKPGTSSIHLYTSSLQTKRSFPCVCDRREAFRYTGEDAEVSAADHRVMIASRCSQQKQVSHQEHSKTDICELTAYEGLANLFQSARSHNKLLEAVITKPVNVDLLTLSYSEPFPPSHPSSQRGIRDQTRTLAKLPVPVGPHRSTEPYTIFIIEMTQRSGHRGPSSMTVNELKAVSHQNEPPWPSRHSSFANLTLRRGETTLLCDIRDSIERRSKWVVHYRRAPSPWKLGVGSSTLFSMLWLEETSEPRKNRSRPFSTHDSPTAYSENPVNSGRLRGNEYSLVSFKKQNSHGCNVFRHNANKLIQLCMWIARHWHKQVSAKLFRDQIIPTGAEGVLLRLLK